MCFSEFQVLRERGWIGYRVVWWQNCCCLKTPSNQPSALNLAVSGAFPLPGEEEKSFCSIKGWSCWWPIQLACEQIIQYYPNYPANNPACLWTNYPASIIQIIQQIIQLACEQIIQFYPNYPANNLACLWTNKKPDFALWLKWSRPSACSCNINFELVFCSIVVRWKTGFGCFSCPQQVLCRYIVGWLIIKWRWTCE